MVQRRQFRTLRDLIAYFTVRFRQIDSPLR